MPEHRLPAALPLNEAQSRHVAVALDRVAEVLEEVRHANVIDASKRSAVDPLVWGLQADVSALQARLPRQVEAPDAARLLAARLGHALVLLQDAGSRGLAGFGTVEPAVQSVLDPALERLALGLVELLDVLSHGSTRSWSSHA